MEQGERKKEEGKRRKERRRRSTRRIRRSPAAQDPRHATQSQQYINNLTLRYYEDLISALLRFNHCAQQSASGQRHVASLLLGHHSKDVERTVGSAGDRDLSDQCAQNVRDTCRELIPGNALPHTCATCGPHLGAAVLCSCCKHEVCSNKRGKYSSRTRGEAAMSWTKGRKNRRTSQKVKRSETIGKQPPLQKLDHGRPQHACSCRDNLLQPVAPRRQGPWVPSPSHTGLFGLLPFCALTPPKLFREYLFR